MTRADWSALTEFLRARGAATVQLSWDDLDTIVGGMPASATTHYPQWWHGDRSHIRAWQAAGYVTDTVRPGKDVVFRRQDRSRPQAAPRRRVTASPRTAPSAPAPEALHAADPRTALVIVPCSKKKAPGGRTRSTVGRAMAWPAELDAARDRMRVAARVTEEVLPAVDRYTGNFWQHAGACAQDAADDGRLLILSGGYGVLDGREAIGDYERVLDLADWPTGLLERLIAERAHRADGDVVCFAARTTDYARLLAHVPWDLPPGRRALLVTLTGVRGTGEIPRRLGRAFSAWWTGRLDELPAGIEVRALA
jgi:hypothetical protein